MLSSSSSSSRLLQFAVRKVVSRTSPFVKTGARTFMGSGGNGGSVVVRSQNRSAGAGRRVLSTGEKKVVEEGVSSEAASSTTTTTAAAAASGKSATEAAGEAAKEGAKTTSGGGLWNSAEFWGGAGALAGWGMSGAAIYDAALQGPEIISMKMTGVLMVYSSLFAWWAYVVIPRNWLLLGCHVTNVVAQSNQMKRALEYKLQKGETEEVKDLAQKAAVGTAAGVACIALSGTIQSAIVAAGLGPLSALAAADAGPFTIHFWAPMSKWLISGASFLEFDRPTDKISIGQYTALTATGFFFSRYALLVIPLNPTLCAVNIALFLSSAWHLGRKINADYISK